MANEPRINPYNFVPLQDPPERSAHRGLHRVGEDGWSGELTCELRPLTPLFTADQRQGTDGPRPFLRNGAGTPILQGTTLKGMIRAVYEAMTNSCLCLANPVGKGKKGGEEVTLYRYQDLGEHANERCNSRDSLCPACRLFGTIQGDQVHLEGRVSFSDAALVEGELVQGELHLGELSTPKPKHGLIYGREGRQGGPIAGRKLYYHHESDLEPGRDAKRTHRTTTILEYAPGGEGTSQTVFRFRLLFRDLAPEELARLLWCLELEEDLAHKLGLAKPLGYGSCRVAVLDGESRVERGAERYRSFDPAAGASSASPWRSGMEKTLAAIRGGIPKELRRLLGWTARPEGDVGYLSWNGYRGMGIDGEGRFVPATAGPGRSGGGGGQPSGGPGFSLGDQLGDLARKFGGGGEPRKPGPSSEPPHRPAVGDKVKVEVVASEGRRHRLRLVDTGEEIDHEQQVPWTRGDRLTVRVKAVDDEGRITAIRP